MDMMMMMQMTLLQQQISGSTRAIAPAAVPPAPVLFNTDAITAAHPRQLNIPDISLAQFCARYRIEEKDRIRLEKMEFHPGDPLDDLGRSLPCPPIPHGIHVESIWNPCCSTWNLPIPHGICFG